MLSNANRKTKQFEFWYSCSVKGSLDGTLVSCIQLCCSCCSGAHCHIENFSNTTVCLLISKGTKRILRRMLIEENNNKYIDILCSDRSILTVSSRLPSSVW